VSSEEHLREYLKKWEEREEEADRALERDQDNM
jgi:hypothetical protein